MICFRGLAHHDISFSGTAAGGYLLLEKILNKIRLSAMTNGQNKGSSREVKSSDKHVHGNYEEGQHLRISSSQDQKVVQFALSSILGERRVTGQIALICHGWKISGRSSRKTLHEMPWEPLLAPKLWTSEQVDRDQLGATSNSVVRHAGPFAGRIRDI